MKSASKSIHSHAKKLQEAFSQGASSSDSHHHPHRIQRLFSKQSSTDSVTFSESGEENRSHQGFGSCFKSRLSFGDGENSGRQMRRLFQKQASYGSASSSGNADTNPISREEQSDSPTRHRSNGGKGSPQDGPKEALQGEVRLTKDVRRMMSAMSSGASAGSFDSLPPILDDELNLTENSAPHMKDAPVKDGVVPSDSERGDFQEPASLGVSPSKSKFHKRRKMKGVGADVSCNDSCIVQ